MNHEKSRAFGMAVGLCERGFYNWDEFRERLIAEISVGDAQHEARRITNFSSECVSDWWLKNRFTLMQRLTNGLPPLQQCLMTTAIEHAILQKPI